MGTVLTKIQMKLRKNLSFQICFVQSNHQNFLLLFYPGLNKIVQKHLQSRSIMSGREAHWKSNSHWNQTNLDLNPCCYSVGSVVLSKSLTISLSLKVKYISCQHRISGQTWLFQIMFTFALSQNSIKRTGKRQEGKIIKMMKESEWPLDSQQ